MPWSNSRSALHNILAASQRQSYRVGNCFAMFKLGKCSGTVELLPVWVPVVSTPLLLCDSGVQIRAALGTPLYLPILASCGLNLDKLGCGLCLWSAQQRQHTLSGFWCITDQI